MAGILANNAHEPLEMPSRPAYLDVREITVGYDNQPLIRDITMAVRPGEIMTLIGPNGSGKSTILKSVIKQLSLLAGSVYLDGRDMASMPGRDIATRLSILMTDRPRPELMTCEDVVATGRYPYTGRMGVLSEEDWRIVRDSLALVHAEELAEKSFQAISDGQRQRVLLARALCQQPELIILDEPTSFLDIRHKLELLSILKQMVHERGLAVVMSLHEIDLAQRVSDVVVCVNGDVIERIGPPEDVFTAEYITHLYGLREGCYDSTFGSIEMPRTEKDPTVFVIGGGGSGVATYRRLQRQEVAFAVGVLAKNDLDYPVAKALASRVVAVPAFDIISEEAIDQAKQLIDRVDRVIVCVEGFGRTNARNAELVRYAQSKGVTVTMLQGDPFAGYANEGDPGEQAESGHDPQSFFANKACPHFPCHQGVEPDEFNCLFCYCPLYGLGDRCGGSFAYTKKGVKNCTGCTVPHDGERAAALVMEKWPLLKDLASRPEEAAE